MFAPQFFARQFFAAWYFPVGSNVTLAEICATASGEVRHAASASGLTRYFAEVTGEARYAANAGDNCCCC